ncbi:hypothetical protein LZ31DRAFT_554575 [Colletotrichum somersetense]|nr:hypothetical protein LZ31DRAFT_554575 [Colletotrichum somersetense]
MSIGWACERRGFGPNSQQDRVLPANQASPTRGQSISPPPDGATPDFFLYPGFFCHPPSSTRCCDGTPAFPGPRAPSPRMSGREAESRHGSSMTLASPALFARFCTWMQACWHRFGTT